MYLYIKLMVKRQKHSLKFNEMVEIRSDLMDVISFT